MDWDLWIGPAKNNGYTPGLHAFSWRGYWEYGTGSLGDMGCHIMDVPIKALGIFDPFSIEASVPRVPYVADYTPAQYMRNPALLAHTLLISLDHLRLMTLRLK